MHIKKLLLLILLTFSCSVISQENEPIVTVTGETLYPLSKDELKRIYVRDVQCSAERENALKAVDELHTIVTDLNADIQFTTAELRRLKDERSALQAEKDRHVEELHKLQMKREKRFVIGLQTGYGINGKPYAGVGLTYRLFAF